MIAKQILLCLEADVFKCLAEGHPYLRRFHPFVALVLHAYDENANRLYKVKVDKAQKMGWEALSALSSD